MTSPFPTPGRFDLDSASTQIGAAVAGVIKMTFRPPGQQPGEKASKELFDSILHALVAGGSACAEVKRLRGGLARLRDNHRPRPHADPTAPGALCQACSLHGALVPWPCEPWQCADHLLTGDEAGASDAG